MIARILGSAPGLPLLGKSHSALWCRTFNRNVLFDCGEGTAQKLLEYKMDNDFLDTIVISHLHPDHSVGLYMVIQMFHLQKRVKPLTIYLPEELETFSESMNMFYLFPDRFDFTLSLLDIRVLNEDIPEIVPVMNSHLLSYKEYISDRNYRNPMSSYSFLIKTTDKVILYTSDIDTTKHLSEYIKQSDTIIIDALHPSKEDILAVLNLTGKQIILVHGISEELRSVIETNPSLNVIIAEDGYQINA